MQDVMRFSEWFARAPSFFIGTKSRDYDRASGFGRRLVLAMVTTIGVAGVVGYVLLAGRLQDAQIASHAGMQATDVASFEATARRAPSASQALASIDGLLDAIGQRPGAVQALVIDPRSVVVASGTGRPWLGKRESSAAITRALSQGIAFAGKASDSGPDASNLEFVSPIGLTNGRYALVVVYDHRILDANLLDIRRALVLIGLLTIFLGSGVFYLVGGRTLMRNHRVALQRATRDGLTDLPNHRAFQDEFTHKVAAAARSGEALSLIVFDIDEFKFLNDRRGHPYGDAVLVRVAEVLRAGRTADRGYRIGGDEFAMLLTQTDSEGARIIAGRLGRSFGETEVFVSIGTSTLRPGQQATDLRAEADAALYEAKHRGGHQAVAFDEISDHVIINTSARMDVVREMIDQERVSTVYQPIWDLSSGSVLGLEALMRPATSDGLSGPAEAFDLAEQIGRVHDLDVLCVSSALRDVPDLPYDALLFINLSPHTLDLDSRGNRWLHEAVTSAGLAPHRVVIEITERFSSNVDAVAACVQLLRDEGFQIALDDVGTGNSGLEMLQKINADFVKIDRSIVLAAATDRRARAVLVAMATYAHQTGAYVIAEGIEDRDTLAFLDDLDDGALRRQRTIEGGQGYGLGRPAPTGPAPHMPIQTKDSAELFD